MTARSRLAALLCAAALAAAPEMAAAQTTAPAPSTDIGNQDGTLSDKLHRNDGVIHPQGDLDADMQKAAPQTGTTPVVPPPGSPGGDPSVVPK